ncbi:phosphocarrier protein [Marininema mesophilum]|uniref:Phosphocarrier protein HPr n=1 Tax=Marininema mesophilum TaxID=1048340 RepID=A0A1H2W761_9BACL|nr:HPr family phosphocarrier protein [Marininema mesophilum]SDW76371.1 phosphocarrier protein [Marininema mesophilum]
MNYEEKVTIQNETGLHARPAAQLVKEAGSFQSTIQLIKGTQEADAKSLLGVMSLSVGKGDELIIRADGEDATEAVQALQQLITTQLSD